jgi:hypothetical protein
MIKGLAQFEDGTLLVVIGLDDRDVAAMRQDEPVMFNLSSLYCVLNQLVVVSYKHPDGLGAMPKHVDYKLIGLTDTQLDELQEEAFRYTPTDGYQFIVFRGDTLEDRQETMQRFIHPSAIMSKVDVYADEAMEEELV